MLGRAQAPHRGWGLALRHRGRTQEPMRWSRRQTAAMRVMPPRRTARCSGAQRPVSERQRCGPPRCGLGLRGDQKPRRAAQRGRVAGAGPRLAPPCLSPQGELGGRPAAASSEGSRGPERGPGRGFAPQPQPALRGARATRRTPPSPRPNKPGAKRGPQAQGPAPEARSAQDTSSGSRFAGDPTPVTCSAGPPRNRRSMASAR